MRGGGAPLGPRIVRFPLPGPLRVSESGEFTVAIRCGAWVTMCSYLPPAPLALPLELGLNACSGNKLIDSFTPT